MFSFFLVFAVIAKLRAFANPTHNKKTAEQKIQTKHI